MADLQSPRVMQQTWEPLSRQQRLRKSVDELALLLQDWQWTDLEMGTVKGLRLDLEGLVSHLRQQLPPGRVV